MGALVQQQRRCCEHPALPCHLFARRRVNVTLDLARSDAALRRTQEVMHGFVSVSGLPELGTLLTRLRGCHVGQRKRSLDLLAHGNADGLMVFGRSLLAPDEADVEEFMKEHAGTLAQLGVERVRLMGCYTGVGEKAERALAHMRARLGIDVLGCTDIVDEHMFDVDGLSPKWDGLFVHF